MTDEKLFKILKKLKKIEPSQEAYEKGLSLLLQKVEERNSQKVSVQEPVRKAKASWQDKLLTPVRVLVEGFVRSRQLAQGVLKVYSSHIYASVLITVLVFGAFGVYSGMLARQALPDNKPLYTLKTALEKTQLTLSLSDTSRVEVRVSHLARRVAELNQLVAKTAKYPERNGHAVEVAIKNTQDEISAVIGDLANVTEKQDAKEINSLKKIVADKVSKFQIALDGVHEDLPENIKDDLGEDVQALSSAVLKINKAIDYVDTDKVTKGAADVATSTSDDLDDIFMTDDKRASTTITTTVDLLVNTSTVNLLPKEQELKAKSQPAEEPFTIEKDTFEVNIGN